MECVAKANGPAWLIAPLVSISSHAPFSETTASLAVTNISYQLVHINCHSPYTSLDRQHPSDFWLIINLKMGLLWSCLNNYLTTGEVSDK